MKNCILYSHDGSGNHGCEALVRTTAQVLKRIDNNINVTLVSERPDEDKKYGIGEICTSIVGRYEQKTPIHFSSHFIKAYLDLKIRKNSELMDMLAEAEAANAKDNDIALSIGGDVYCYGEGVVKRLAREQTVWKAAGLKTVYWGCSIEPELVEEKYIQDDISRYDLILARESISYDAIKKVNPNTIQTVDTAFLLEKADVDLPNDREYIGINLSPMVQAKETQAGILNKNVENLINYILDNTDLTILLIPHVVWSSNDDRIILSDIYEKYINSGRVIMVQDSDCRVLKGYISKCRYFIGARTHSTIAAYSLCIPTVVIGYSVKARGIAKDLFGTEQDYVIPIQSIENTNKLCDSFKWLQKNEKDIREHLKAFIPEYIKGIDIGISKLAELMK